MSLKNLTTKVNTTMQKRVLGEKSLTIGEVIGLGLLLGFIYWRYKPAFIKDIYFWVVLVIVLIMFALW